MRGGGGAYRDGGGRERSPRRNARVGGGHTGGMPLEHARFSPHPLSEFQLPSGSSRGFQHTRIISYHPSLSLSLSLVSLSLSVSRALFPTHLSLTPLLLSSSLPLTAVHGFCPAAHLQDRREGDTRLAGRADFHCFLKFSTSGETEGGRGGGEGGAFRRSPVSTKICELCSCTGTAAGGHRNLFVCFCVYTASTEWIMRVCVVVPCHRWV